MLNAAYDKFVRLSIGKDFSRFDPITIKFSDLPKLMCSENVLYSPSQFKENKRKAANFTGLADFLVFDFDEGWNEEHEQLFNQFIGFKVPTKSHLKEKNGIVCERYRVVLLLDSQIHLTYREHKSLYKHIMRDLNLASDKSCVDACRFYYSAPQPLSNCVVLKGKQYFPWQLYNYKDLQYAPLDISTNNVDISKYTHLDVSYFDRLEHSKRYPCPLCQLEGYDQKGHHLGFNKDDDYPTCFFEEEHSKILRKIYKQYKYGTIEDEMEAISDMAKEKCTPDLIKVGERQPKPTNYTDNLLDMYNKALDMLETDDKVELDIETYSQYYVAETLEEATERLGANYKYIKGAYQAKCGEFDGVALDTFKNKIRLITLSGGGTACPFDLAYATEEQLKRILNIIKTKFVIGQNLKFDLKSIMATFGKDYCPQYCFDTLLASRMIHMAQDPEDQQCGHNLESIAYRFLGYRMDKHVEHSWGNDNLTPEQLKYAAMDVRVLRPIYEEQVKQFKELYGPFDTVNYDITKLEFLGPLVKEHPILALEMQTLLEVIRIEFEGIRPNFEMMKEKIAFYNKEIDDLDAELGINCGSAKQTLAFVQERISPEIQSTAIGALAPYRDNPIVVRISDSKAYRTRRGLMESMSETFVHPYDGRIHPKFNQLLSTGRFSCSKPNMQQIPRDIKNQIYQSLDDTIIFDTDYAAVELRLATVVSGDPVMIEAYKNNTDMHYLTASKICHKEIPHTPEEKEDAEKSPNSKFVNKFYRGLGKSLNFGLIYGMHWTTFKEVAKNSGIYLEDAETEEYCNIFFKTYTGLHDMVENARKEFMSGQNRKVVRWLRNQKGQLYKKETEVPYFSQCRTLLGRILAADSSNKLMNFPVQGSGADTIKIAICKMGYDTRNAKSSYRTINLVHDDTIGESKPEDFDTNAQIFRDALEFAINYILRYKFHTPVNQDFCVLSMFGKEVFFEKALTLSDIKAQLIEQMNRQYDKMQKADTSEQHDELLEDLKNKNEVLEKLKAFC